MAQVPAAWAALPGSRCVSSEDESWLNQSGYHLSDESDDARSNLLSQAYVQALATFKQSATGQDAPTASALPECTVKDSPAPLLGLPAASPATIAPGQAAALSLGGKHTTSSCTNISAESEQPPQRPLEDKHVEPAMRDAHPKLPKQADLASKLAAADSTPGIKATSSAPSLSQHVASVPVATAVAACGDKSMPDRQQGNMQALQMLFPQELQPESASSDMHTPLENLSEHVAAMHSATAEQQGTAKTSQSSLASPAAASDVRQAASPFSSNADALARREAHSAAAAPAAEAGARVDAPAVSLGSLQYTLSMDEMALIHENARQYMQEHAASPSRTEAHAHAAAPPSQPEWLAPAADSVQAGSGPSSPDVPANVQAPAAEDTVEVKAQRLLLAEDTTAVKHEAQLTAEDSAADDRLVTHADSKRAIAVAAAAEPRTDGEAAQAGAGTAGQASVSTTQAPTARQVTPVPAQPSPVHADTLPSVVSSSAGAAPQQLQVTDRSDAELPSQEPAQQAAQQLANSTVDASAAATPPTAAPKAITDAQRQEADDVANRQADAFLADLQLGPSEQQQVNTLAQSASVDAGAMPVVTVRACDSVVSPADATAAYPAGDVATSQAADFSTPAKSTLVSALSAEQLRAILSSAGLMPAAAPVQATMPEPAGITLAQHQGVPAAVPASHPPNAPAPSALASAPAASSPSATAALSQAGTSKAAEGPSARLMALPASLVNDQEQPAAGPAPFSNPANKPATAVVPGLEQLTKDSEAGAKARKASGEVGRMPIVWKPVDTSRKAAALSAVDTAKPLKLASKPADAKQGPDGQPSLSLPSSPSPASSKPVPAATPSQRPAAAAASSAPKPAATTPSAAAAAFTHLASSPSFFSPAEKKARKKSDRKARQAVAKMQAWQGLETRATASALLPHGSDSLQGSGNPQSTGVSLTGPAPLALPVTLPLQGSSRKKRKREEAWAATEHAPPAITQVSQLMSEHHKHAKASLPPFIGPPEAPDMAAALSSPPAHPPNPKSPPAHAPHCMTDPSFPSAANAAGPSSSNPPAAKKTRTLSAAEAHDLEIMQQIHGYSPVPLAGATAVVPWLKNAKTLITDQRQKFSLRIVAQAIGEFAIGSVREAEIFLGDFHDLPAQHMQIGVIAGLFGVAATQSKTPSRFHETYRLTSLVKTPYADILDQDTDPVVYFIIKLSHLCHDQGHNKQEVHKYRMELNAVLSLGKAIAQHVQAKSGCKSSFPRGVKHRIAQLLKLGYLAVKRPKKDPPNPPLYPAWQGKPLYGPTSRTPSAPPKVQPLPAAVATAAPGSAAVPFIPGPAVAPVSLKLVQDPGSLPSMAVSSAPPNASSAALPASLASLSLPTSATAQAADAGVSAPVSGTDNIPSAAAPELLPSPRSSPISLTPPRTQPAPSGPPTAPSGQLALLPPAVASVPAAPPSGGATFQAGPPPPADSTAALVAAVGPLFETFVAETAAVLASPDMSLQSLVGKVTQDLAAAIAAAAMQVVEARQHQSHALAVVPAPTTTVHSGRQQVTAADADQPDTAVAMSRPLLEHVNAVVAGSELVTAPPETSKAAPAAAPAQALIVASTDSPAVGLRQEDSALSVSAKVVDRLRGALKSNLKSSSSDGSSLRQAAAGAAAAAAAAGGLSKASKQVNTVDAKSQQGSQVRAASNSPPSISTLGLNPAANSKRTTQAPAAGTQHRSKAGLGLDGKTDSHASDSHNLNASKKRSTVDGSGSSQDRAAKRPCDAKAGPKGPFEYEGYIVPGLDVSKYEVGSGKGATGQGNKSDRQRDAKDGKVKSRPESSNSRGSRSSGRSDKGSRELGRSYGSKDKTRSPREPSRLNVRSMHLAGPSSSGRRNVSAVPSTLTADFAQGSGMLPFDPAVNGAMCRGFGSPDFRPVGLQLGRDAPWMRPSALSLPDVMHAPDFTPHFSPGGPAN